MDNYAYSEVSITARKQKNELEKNSHVAIRPCMPIFIDTAAWTEENRPYRFSVKSFDVAYILRSSQLPWNGIAGKIAVVTRFARYRISLTQQMKQSDITDILTVHTYIQGPEESGTQLASNEGKVFGNYPGNESSYNWHPYFVDDPGGVKHDRQIQGKADLSNAQNLESWSMARQLIMKKNSILRDSTKSEKFRMDDIYEKDTLLQSMAVKPTETLLHNKKWTSKTTNMHNTSSKEKQAI